MERDESLEKKFSVKQPELYPDSRMLMLIQHLWNISFDTKRNSPGEKVRLRWEVYGALLRKPEKS